MSTLVDATCGKAVDTARDAVVAEVGADRVGEHVEAVADDDRVVTHLFECKDPAYRGWRWAVTIARAPRARNVTIDEVVLLAGPDSIVAPAWHPFAERVLPGDLSVGDVLPTAPDDIRLVPGYLASGDTEFELEPPNWEPGLGRLRMLSVAGRDEAAERWVRGDTGPASAMAKAANETCSSCGFLLPLGGPLGQAFGVCGNAFAPSDGQVVAMAYGCGAHSEAIPEPKAEILEAVVDDLGYDDFVLDLAGSDDEPEIEPEAEAALSSEPNDADADMESSTAEPDDAATAQSDAETTDEHDMNGSSQ